MIKVTALTSGKYVPSARFRVRQHIEPLQALGITVREYTPLISKYALPPWWNRSRSRSLYRAWQGLKVLTRIPSAIASWTNDITWLQKKILEYSLTLEVFLKRPLVLDVDDAIWLKSEASAAALRVIANHAEIIIAGNNYIADWFSVYSSNIHILPTAVDTDYFKPLDQDEPEEKQFFVVGWLGTSSNLPYLEAIEPALNEFIKTYTDVRLLVFADQPPRFRRLPAGRVRFVRWSTEEEVRTLHQMDVGLMPLPDNPWTQGKCSFKMLQYMACGIPAIVSPVGMNKEVLAKGPGGLPAVEQADWYEALSFFYRDREALRNHGYSGRTIVEEYFSRRKITQSIATIFKGII